MEGLVAILQAVNTFALAFFAYAFVKGWIVAKPTVDRLLEEAENRTTKLVNEIMEGMEKAVERAITAGLRGAKSGEDQKQAAD